MGARTRTAVVAAAVLLAVSVAFVDLDRATDDAPTSGIAEAAHAPTVGAAADDTGDAVDPIPRSEPTAEDGSMPRRRALAGSDRGPSLHQAEGTGTDDALPSPLAGRDAPRDLDVERGPGELTTVPGSSERVGVGQVRTFAVEVEAHLADHGQWFVADVERMLFDERGWTADGSIALRRVDGDRADVRLTLASPATVDELCAPLRTNGRFSCWNGERAVINAWRWEHGAAAYGEDIEGYRTYLVNHEFGHGLGHGHVGCPAPGAPAPVMMQQTIGVEGCEPNPWPYPDAAD